MRYLILLFLFSSVLFAFKDHKIEPVNYDSDKYKKIKILDSKILNNPKIDGVKFTEISDIAYDEGKDLFYAVSDKGRIFRLSIGIKDKKIDFVKAISGSDLRGLNGKRLKKKYRDAEGLALIKEKGKTNILVSFEGKSRVTQYDERFKAIKDVKFSPILKKLIKGNHSNDGLEAVTYSEKYGVITAGEYPLRWKKRHLQGIFGRDGEICKIKRSHKKSAITEFEMLPDGNLLMLLRNFRKMSFSFVTTLRKVYLDDIENGICKTEKLIKMDSKKGWHNDNFEGLTHYKDNLYLMISDDNNNFLQNTILTLFEIKE